MKQTLTWLVVVAGITKLSLAGTAEEWAFGAPNACNSDSDSFVDFEGGIDDIQIESTNPGFSFTNTGGLDWLFGDVRVPSYNVNNGDEPYSTNGNFFAWLGTEGDRGRIDFAGETATYVSILASIGNSGLNMEAYDSDDNLVDSVSAGENLFGGGDGEERFLTRMTVSNMAGISYVEIFDSGNFWLIDDLCTDAASPCVRLEGRDPGPSSTRVDLVFLQDNDYTGTDEDFLNKKKFSENADRFNFYIAPILQGSHGGDFSCGAGMLPDNFFDLCPFADAVVVLHSDTATDCSNGGVYGSEDNNVRSFIHESGHGLFGLADEYDDIGRGCITSYAAGANIWANEDDCVDAIEANDPEGGLSCFQFTTCAGGRWKIDDGADNIMDDGTNFANGWSPSSIWWINSFFTTLAAGPTTAPAGELEPASPEKSVNIKIDVTANSLAFKNAALRLSPPRQYGPSSTGYLTVSIFNEDDALLTSFGVENPLVLGGEPSNEGGSLVLEIVNDFVITAPYFPTGTNMVITDGNSALDVDLSSFSTDTPTVPNPSTAVCVSVSVNTDPGLCSASTASIDGGSFDPHGRPIDVFQTPIGPYPLGETEATLKVTNIDEWTATCTETILVSDNEDPLLIIPDDEIVQCDSIPLAGDPVTTDNCEVASVNFSEEEVPGSCPNSYTLLRTWTVEDTSQNQVSDTQTITVEDTTGPEISCDAFTDISPNMVNQQSPVSFTPTAADNCSAEDGVMVTVTGYDCYAFAGNGREIDRNNACSITLNGDTASVFISGGVGTIIEWTVEAVDECGNVSEAACFTNVVGP